MKKLSQLSQPLQSTSFGKFAVKQIKPIINTLIRRETVAMFHIGRCGSTVLGEMLDEHSKVHWGNEIFRPFMKNSPDQHREALVKRVIHQNSNIALSTVFGFETKYLSHQHLCDKNINMSIDEYIAFLQELGVSKFILLHRKNYLRRAISIKVAKLRRGHHSWKKVNTPTSIHLEVNHSPADTESETSLKFKSFDTIRQSFEHLQTLLEPHEHLTLYYEDHILPDPRIAYTKVCNFLEIEEESPTIKVHRSNPFKVEEMLTNFAEVESILKHTQYSWMLYD
ncbi:MAG: sulfotransferase [Microcystaceae cyanobacterium]